jgi:hypothetical protein
VAGGAGFTSVALASLLGEDDFWGSKPSPLMAKRAGRTRSRPKSRTSRQSQERHLFVHVWRAVAGGHVRLQADDVRRDNQTIQVKTFGRGGHKNQGRIVEPRWKFKQYGSRASG